jgi:hypothetical protein
VFAGLAPAVELGMILAALRYIHRVPATSTESRATPEHPSTRVPAKSTMISAYANADG